MKLVIVESPSKAKTIEKYLGSDYKVVASFGHIRDLETSTYNDLGVDIENDFLPKYVISKDKEKVIKRLKEMSSQADEVLLASDPDREGEAIAWHLADVLELDVSKTKRLEFHEVTKKAIIEAIENPRTIDMSLVASQEARRITDRIIGFRLSSLVQRKLNARSAGRVQSVALKLIVDREREILNFKAKTSYKVESTLSHDSKKLTSTLVNEKYETLKLTKKEDAESLVAGLTPYSLVKQVNREEKINYSPLPLTTSSLQQESFNHYKYAAKKTMKIAQDLYEGKKVGNRYTGLITYMRTDSVRLSPQFTFAARDYIKNNFGEEYVGIVRTQKEDDKVQDAHEAIRPTDINLVPDDIKKYLSAEEYNIYKLIWIRAVCSLMSGEKVNVTKVILTNNNNLFLLDGKERVFDGYKKIYDQYTKSKYTSLPSLSEGQEIKVSKNTIKEDTTKPPARYSEASLIKSMEELGIGRPSTYAATIEALNKSQYVQSENRYLKPTEISLLVNDKLQEFFESFINIKYTANMEKDLDLIALNEMDKNSYLHRTYDDFEKLFGVAIASFRRVDMLIDETCPKCGSQLRISRGKYGEFISCSNYPNCDYKRNKELVIPENAKKCPKCKDGYLIVKKGKYGNFLGCTGYPTCNHIEKIITKSK